MALTTLTRIRALSGFRAVRFLDGSLGTGNGSNVVFSPQQVSMFCSPSEDAPQVSEITVMVGGTTVGVASITENNVVLSAAPANNAVVTANYWGHNLSGVDIGVARSEAEAEVFGRLADMYTYEQLSTSPLIQKIVAYLAAASISDEAYNENGANSLPGSYPPERLRRVANGLLESIVLGTITLAAADNTVIPVVAAIDSWIDETNYGPERDRLFEDDPFDRTDDILGWRWEF